MERGAAPARERDTMDLGLTVAAAILALAAGYIHSTLGGMMFTLNAIGYAVAAIALVIPLGIVERFRWLVRLGLLGYTLATIGGWILFGARYDVAYYTLAIELVLVAVLAVSIWRMDGGVGGVLAHLRALPSDLADLIRR